MSVKYMISMINHESMLMCVRLYNVCVYVRTYVFNILLSYTSGVIHFHVKLCV